MIAEGLFGLISADPAVRVLLMDTDVSEVVRLYPVMLPPNQGAFPAVTFQRIPGGSSDYTLDNKKTRTARFQFDSYALSFAESDQVLAAINDVLEGFNGALPDGTRVLFISQTIEGDQFEDDGRTYRSLCEYEIEFIDK